MRDALRSGNELGMGAYLCLESEGMCEEEEAADDVAELWGKRFGLSMDCPAAGNQVIQNGEGNSQD